MKKYDYNTQVHGFSFDELFVDALKQIVKDGKWNKPRGMSCKEIIAPQLILYKQDQPISLLRARKLNRAFGIVEMFTYLSQVSKPDVLVKYNKNIGNFINEATGDFDAPYGKRIATGNQLEYCYKTLKSDPDSRRAVIMIHQPEDCRETKDSACTLSLQFLIRDGKLDLIATMRSNDIILGMCYDIPAFTFIQTVMAFWLDVSVGRYIHQPGSLHFYQEFSPMVDDCIDEMKENEDSDDKKIDVKHVWDQRFENTRDALDIFWRCEEEIRETGKFVKHESKAINNYLQVIHEYWKNKQAPVKSLFS